MTDSSAQPAGDAVGPEGPGGIVLDALGDPTRRRVLELLREGEQTVSDLTRSLPVTQSAVSQHLRRLKDAGLVTDRSAGTRRYYRVRLDGLSPLRAYLDSFWDDVLSAFTTFAQPPTLDGAPDTGPARPDRRPR